jgi:hypothetical protein
MNCLIFGSSLHQESGKWQVWAYVEDEDYVHPLGAYDDQLKAETAVFDIAHTAAKAQDPDGIEEILKNKTGEGRRFSQKEEAMLKTLVKDAVAESSPPEAGKASVSVRRTDYDQIYVVRHVETKT